MSKWRLPWTLSKQTFQVEIYSKVIGEIRHEIFSYNKIQMGDHSIWRNVSRDNIYDSINSMYDYQKIKRHLLHINESC